MFDDERVSAIRTVVGFRPVLSAGALCAGLVAASLEGVGLGFILPIVEFAQSGGDTPGSAPVRALATVYGVFGFPLTLETAVIGVLSVMGARYGASFLGTWVGAALTVRYERHLKGTLFERSLDAEVEYYDTRGSDEVLNAVVTQAQEGATTIQRLVAVTQQTLIATVYLAIALALAPVLTVVSLFTLGGLTYLVRYVVDPGYRIGERVATANEAVQSTVQAGTQGIRDVKLFGLTDRLYDSFATAVDDYVDAKTALIRNQKAIEHFYSFATASVVFVLVYLGLTFTSLSLGSLGVFLFAMFRLGPKVSNINHLVYEIEATLPHLVRTQRFVDELDTHREQTGGNESVGSVDRVAFEDVSFRYANGDDPGRDPAGVGDHGPDDGWTLSSISFEVETGDFVGFVGGSGAGKSTIAALLVRLYDPDEGRVTANGTPIEAFDVDDWRSRVAVVRQRPYVFDDTLRNNVTVARPGADDDALDRVCRAARVTEFLDDLPAGYDTEIGDDGVRLSGGQRQRVALARALLKDADVLVLDEATSDLDTVTERDVQAAIESMDRAYATLVIAHRLSTVRNADRIYTIEDGEIIEVGDHEELLATGGQYAEFYRGQTDAGRPRPVRSGSRERRRQHASEDSEAPEADTDRPKREPTNQPGQRVDGQVADDRRRHEGDGRR